MARQDYLIALGSNMRHALYGSPRALIAAALKALDNATCQVVSVSRVIEPPPLGPSRRRYANAAAIVRTYREPDAMLRKLQAIEHRFGRRRTGKAWSARTLDLDIVLWSGGAWAHDDGESSLVIPHPFFRERAFVLGPAATIAGRWRDPLSGLTVRHLLARLTKPPPAPR